MNETLLDTEMPVIQLTPEAVSQVKFLLKKQAKQDQWLRVGVKGGGCSGLSYVMNIVDNPTERDYQFHIDGVNVVVDKKSAEFISGVTLGYSTRNLLEGGWTWSNPLAAKSCGCGTSFTPK